MDKVELYNTILAKAHAAADAAILAKGPEDMNALDCGFAWVVIAGNEPLARHCRKHLAGRTDLPHAERRRFGSKHWQRGWEFWGPGEFHGQAIGHKLAGATAFNEVLAQHGIRGTVGSRYD